MTIEPGFTSPTYFIPVTVACSRYNQRATLTGAWLREAVASLEHHATLPEYAHIREELTTKAATLNAILGGRF